jgi:hypothetical protein
MRHGLLLVILSGIVSIGFCSYFSDNFDDNEISDWFSRCGQADWYAVSGQARVSTNYNCSALICPWEPETSDVILSTSGTATHVLGLIARLDEFDSGIYAYVSPDDDVARIRIVGLGSTSTILNSLNADFPEHVDYELTFICNGDQLLFEILVPSTSEYWQIETVDPQPVQGACGIACGDEPLASWNWFCAESYEYGVEDPTPQESDCPQLAVTPNPSCGAVTISMEGASVGPCRFSIYDLSGRMIAEGTLPAEHMNGFSSVWEGISIDGEQVPPGVYMVRCDVSGCGAESGVMTSRLIRID